MRLFFYFFQVILQLVYANLSRFFTVIFRLCIYSVIRSVIPSGRTLPVIYIRPHSHPQHSRTPLVKLISRYVFIKRRYKPHRNRCRQNQETDGYNISTSCPLKQLYKKIQNERFIRQGKKYRGIIIKKRREIAYKHSRYFATVRFDADGVSYEKEVRYIPLIGQENAEDMMLIYPPGQPDKVMSESFLKWERTMVHMFE